MEERRRKVRASELSQYGIQPLSRPAATQERGFRVTVRKPKDPQSILGP